MYLRIAASVVFLGIAIGAFGAHMLEDILTEHDQIDNWETGCLYHLIHGLALMLCATVLPSRKLSFWAFLLGIFFFSGSLYVMGLTGITALGRIVPIGGVLFLIGWLGIIIQGNKGIAAGAVTIFLVFTAGASSVFAEEDYRVFSDKSGQSLVATVVGISEDRKKLKVRRQDGQEFEFETLRLSLRDQQFLKQWIKTKSTPLSVIENTEYVIEVEIDKSKLSRDRRTSESTKYYTVPTFYEISVVNKSREPLANPTIEYFIFVENEVDLFDNGGSTSYTSYPKYKTLVKSGLAQLEDLQFYREQKVETVTIPIEEVVWDGNNSYREDEIGGVIGVVKDGTGEIIHEFRSDEKLVERENFADLVKEFGKPSSGSGKEKKPTGRP